MKILFLLHSTGIYEGSVKSFLNLCIGLRAKDIDTYVICPDNKGVFCELRNNSIPCFTVPVKPNVFPRKDGFKNILLYLPRVINRYIYNKVAQKKITKLCHKINPDIIHTNVGVINVGFLVSQKLGLPHIYHLREYQDKDFNYNIIPSKEDFKNNLGIKNSYAISITKDIKKYFGEDNPHISVVYNGIIKEMPTIKYVSVFNRKYFLFAGRLEKNKGIEECLYAFSMFCKTNEEMELWIAGDTTNLTYKEKLQNLSHTLQISDRVNFLGMRKDIEHLMQNARAFIMSSVFEGFGRTTAEAMANECLVIGNNQGGTKEQFDNGLELNGSEIGLRYSGVTELANQMTKVQNMQDSEYHKYIQRAKKTVKALYTTDKNVNDIINFYNSISNI